MKYEYKTTIGFDLELGENNSKIDPKQPDGDGWEMCGMSSVLAPFFNPAIKLYWSWRRVIKAVKKTKTTK
jgi:hypothetical protein